MICVNVAVEWCDRDVSFVNTEYEYNCNELEL